MNKAFYVRGQGWIYVSDCLGAGSIWVWAFDGPHTNEWHKISEEDTECIYGREEELPGEPVSVLELNLFVGLPDALEINLDLDQLRGEFIGD